MPGQVAGAAADVQDVVARLGAAEFGEAGEGAVAAAGETDVAEEFVGTRGCDGHTGCVRMWLALHEASEVRFHLWQGLSKRVSDIAAAHRGCLAAAVREPEPALPPSGRTVQGS